ncbi:CRISPR-associated nuclease/helicase Cas3 [Trueperella bernardiae]|uniref:CRISPR-associated nuclease/helicase Cas3 n=1 Tax=Trueperella bernardiae TaxID=59561 RepID=A0A0W1KKR3_9ACTO|nr:CRISPR-associated helicase/endonuclease Cas3 [Trueperella bernardiae]KTF04580.1 CRISPR-associated nuclease/helicase Cas3 [Trueperella bernardiae]
MKTHERVWAKLDGEGTTYPLLAHLLDSAAVAGALFDHWLRPGLRELLARALAPGESEEAARGVVELLVGCHDLGKASEEFQYQPRMAGPRIDAVRRQLEAEEGVSFDNPQAILKRAGKRDYRRHERVGALSLQGAILDENFSAARYWRVIPALGHHGRYSLPGEELRRNTDRRRYISHVLSEPWNTIRRDLLDALCEATGQGFPDADSRHGATETILLSGLTVLADRIASQEAFVAAGSAARGTGELSLTDPRAWLERRRREALAHIDATVGIYRGWGSPEAARAAILGGHEPRQIQAIAGEVGDGLLSVMTPTGGGKTEAAMLRHASANERLIFLLPTQATSNALMRRIQKFYEGTPNVAALAHGLASVEDFYATPVTVEKGPESERYSDGGGLYPTDFVKSRSARLLAPVCVGTVDQALLGALPRKWTHLRLLALANAHVVVDEVHTLDLYQTELLRPIVSWLKATNARVTFLTATMPSWQRETLLAHYGAPGELPDAHFPSIETLTTSGQLLRSEPAAREAVLDIQRSEETIDQVPESHVRWASRMRERYPRARIGIICNRVAHAREVAKALENAGDTILLHSRMTAEHRRRNAERLEHLLGPEGEGQAVFVVGTQAIEASLDIDLDLLRTELAPAPSLIQRAGRAWRRTDPRRSQRLPGVERLPMWVVRVAGDDDDERYSGLVLPYMAGELGRVWNWLSSHEQLRIPDDCQGFIDATAFRFSDIDPNRESAINEAAKAALRKSAGKNARVDLDEILSGEPSLGMFSGLTGTKDATDDFANGTRLVETERLMVVCVGDPSVVPGAWPESLEALQCLRGSDKESVKRALRASMPIPGNSKLEGIESDLVSLAESTSVLAGYWALTNAEKYYDHAGFLG